MYHDLLDEQPHQFRGQLRNVCVPFCLGDEALGTGNRIPQFLDGGFFRRNVRRQLPLLLRVADRQRLILILNHLILTGKLYTYLADLNEQAQERYWLIIRQMMEVEGVTEDSKRRSQLKWIRAMSSIITYVEENIKHELIYI